MRFFFRSRKFKIGVIVFAVLLVISIIARIAGGIISPQSNLLSAIMAPFQKIVAAASGAISDLDRKISGNEVLIMENAKLKEEINRLNEQMAEYDTFKNENEFYKNYLGIKDSNPDFSLLGAVIISKDTTDAFGGFTVDRGSMHGVEAYDPVITDAGLVGYVSQVGVSSSKVTTILSPAISVGVTDSRTGDSGVISGELTLSASGHTKMKNLQRSASVAVGDYIVTAGGGVFPDGLLVGKIGNIAKEQYSSALYAEVEPFVRVQDIKQVMIITDFEGRSLINMGGFGNE